MYMNEKCEYPYIKDGEETDVDNLIDYNPGCNRGSS